MDEKEQQARIEQERREQAESGYQTPEELAALQWDQTKTKLASQLTAAELKRLAEEKEALRAKRDKEAFEVGQARNIVEKQYWDDLQKSCLEGDVTERFAIALIRISNKGLLTATNMRPNERVRGISQILRLHNIEIRDGRKKPNVASYMAAEDLFVSDVFVHKGDPFEFRRQMSSPGAGSPVVKTTQPTPLKMSREEFRKQIKREHGLDSKTEDQGAVA